MSVACPGTPAEVPPGGNASEITASSLRGAVAACRRGGCEPGANALPVSFDFTVTGPDGTATISATCGTRGGVRWTPASFEFIRRNLMDYRTGDTLRVATPAKVVASREAAKLDGGAGVIEVDDVSCYVGE